MQLPLQALGAMRRAGEVPKLGAVQRWVRLAGMVGLLNSAHAFLSGFEDLYFATGARDGVIITNV